MTTGEGTLWGHSNRWPAVRSLRFRSASGRVEMPVDFPDEHRQDHGGCRRRRAGGGGRFGGHSGVGHEIVRRSGLALGISAGPRSGAASSRQCVLVPIGIGPIHRGRTRATGPKARPRGRPPDVDSAGHLGFDWPGSFPGGNRELRAGFLTQCRRSGDRPIAGLAPLWRAMGEALAGCGPVCRHRGRDGRLSRAGGLALPELRHRRLQCRQAVLRVCFRADRRRFVGPKRTA